MQLLKTTIVPADEGLMIEMSFGNPDDDPDNSPYLAFRVPLEVHAVGRPPLAELQRVALQRAQTVIVEQLPSFGQG